MHPFIKSKVFVSVAVSTLIISGSGYLGAGRIIKNKIAYGYGGVPGSGNYQTVGDSINSYNYPAVINFNQQATLTKTHGLSKIVVYVPKGAVKQSTVFEIQSESGPDSFIINSSSSNQLEIDYNVTVYMPLPGDVSKVKVYFIDYQGKYQPISNAKFDSFVGKVTFNYNMPGKFYIGEAPSVSRVEGKKIFGMGTLVREPSKRIYVVTSKGIRPIRTLSQLKAYRGKRILNVKVGDLSAYQIVK